MQRVTTTAIVLAAWLSSASASASASAPLWARAQQQSQNQELAVDGIAARIEGDIITESEIDELAAFQRLVEGKAGTRDDIIRELTDQWIVKNEAQNSHYTRPSADDVKEALAGLAHQLGSDEALHQKMAETGLTEASVRRQLELQIYLNRFLDYKFRAAAQVDEKQIEDYYQGEFTKQAQANGQTLPPLDDVHAEIHRLLTERIVTDRSTKWLDDARSRLRIEIIPKASGS